MKQFICKGRCYGEDYEVIYIIARTFNEAASLAEDWFDDVVYLREI